MNLLCVLLSFMDLIICIQHIIRGMKCVDPLTARHAMALMYHVASYDPVSARNLMRPFLGHSSELNLSDVSTRVFYVRILSIIGNSTVKEHSKFWRVRILLNK